MKIPQTGDHEFSRAIDGSLSGRRCGCRGNRRYLVTVKNDSLMSTNAVDSIYERDVRDGRTRRARLTCHNQR